MDFGNCYCPHCDLNGIFTWVSCYLDVGTEGAGAGALAEAGAVVGARVEAEGGAGVGTGIEAGVGAGVGAPSVIINKNHTGGGFVPVFIFLCTFW